MPRLTAKRLTQKMLDGAKPRAADWYIWDTEVAGLGLRILPTGRKTWVYRWIQPGVRRSKAKRIKRLGTYRDNEDSRVVTSLAEARRMGMDLRVKVDRGEDPSAKKRSRTIAEFWPKFIDHKVSEGLSPQTIRGYQAHYRAHISNPNYGIAELDIDDVDARRLTEFRDAVLAASRARVQGQYDSMVESGKKSAEELKRFKRKLDKAGNGAANSVMLTMGSLFAWLLEKFEVEVNPCKAVRRKKTAGRDKELILDSEDARDAIDLINAHAPSSTIRGVLLMLIYSLQRMSDIKDRRWEDVVLDDPGLPFPYLRIEQHKSSRATQQAKKLPLVGEMLEVTLERWPGSPVRAARDGEGGWTVEDQETGESWPAAPASAWAHRLPPATGPMFPGVNPGRPVTNLLYHWKQIARHSERPRVRASDLHGLRHAGASRLQAMGVTKEAIRDLLHHRSMKTTDIYLAQTADTLMRLGDVLSPADPASEAPDP